MNLKLESFSLSHGISKVSEAGTRKRSLWWSAHTSQNSGRESST
jgi:hypothetical protein